MGIPFRGSDPSPEDQRGVTGLLIDFAARLTSGLNTPQAILAATKAIPGIMRFATDAEATAATIDTVTLTPKQALALEKANPHTFATFDALFADAILPEGAEATVARYDLTGGNIYHRQSLWQKSNGAWMPVGSTINVETGGGTGTKAALDQIVTKVSAAGSKAFIAPGTRGRDVNNSALYIWSGSAWIADAITGALQTITTNASVGTSATVIANLPQNFSLVSVHLIAPNYDRQDLLWVAQSPYDPTGFAGLLSTKQINNTPGYGAPAYAVASYALQASIANTGTTSPVRSVATATPMGMN